MLFFSFETLPVLTLKDDRRVKKKTKNKINKMKRIPPYDHPSYTPDHLVTYVPLFNRPKRKKKNWVLSLF